jgi:hypothetical protein
MAVRVAPMSNRFGPRIHIAIRNTNTPRVIFSDFDSGPSSASFSLASSVAPGVSVMVGLASLNITKGIVTSASSPGTLAARAHWPHVMSMPSMPASSTTSGLAAMAVRNIAEVTALTWKADAIRKDPIFSAPSSGSLS